MGTEGNFFSRDVTGLPTAGPTEVLPLAPGDRFDLSIGSVAKTVGGGQVRMLAYNGSVPGPTLRVREGSAISVDITNHGDLETTVHWHGLRLDNRYDGTDLTQHPIEVGGSFRAVLAFPDPGAYWYHPHIRSDYGLEMGLYGGVVVEPTDPDYWPACHRDVLLTLDDILIEDGAVAPFDRDEPAYAAMGRFGNVMLVNGSDAFTFDASPGEIVRFYVVNTANTRVFRVAIPGSRTKLVGGDSGRVEHEEFVDDVLLGPSERVVVDVLFAEPGTYELHHLTPEHTYSLGTITVAGDAAQPDLVDLFEELRTNDEMVTLRSQTASYLGSPPDKTVILTAVMDFAPAGGGGTGVYACPMHPEVVSDTAENCPKCGMKLLPVAPSELTYSCPMHPEVVSEQPGHCPRCAMKLLPTQLIRRETGKARDGNAHLHEQEHESTHERLHEHMHEPAGHEATEHAHGGGSSDDIEWEDDMVEVNRMTTRSNMLWKLVDQATGAENQDIDWTFRVGDQVKIRLVNEMAGDHPMHHPFHIHAAGRFLVLTRDGVTETNLAWNDTVLLRTGETVDILLDVTSPGRWMAHCHIAEHHENGMMFDFVVQE